MRERLLGSTVEMSNNSYCPQHYTVIKSAFSPACANFGIVVALALITAEGPFHRPAIRAVFGICGAILLFSTLQVLPTTTSRHDSLPLD
jgi:ABC-type enterochelin transport system permease subunit